MTSQPETSVQLKSLAPPPADLVPHEEPRGILDKLWAEIVPPKIPEARATVADPTAFPFGAVALLDFYRDTRPRPTYLGHATGFFLKPDLVVTAAHNLIYSGAEMVAIFPGWDSRRNRSAMIPALRWSQSTARDISVLLTQANAPMTIPLQGALSHNAELVGYAFNYPDGSRRMSRGFGSCRPNGPRACAYAILAQQGDSGGPVFASGEGAMAMHRALEPAEGGTMLGIGESLDADLVALIGELEAQARWRP